jgi:hypothetical protein
MLLRRIDLCTFVAIVSAMKLTIPVICFALGALSLSISAQQLVPAEVEDKLIPTEISEPPYQVGQLPSQQGYYIERPGQTSINFRIVANKIRIYWIDADGLIAPPESSAGNVRLNGKPKIRSYFNLQPISAAAGLGGEGIVRPPHFFNVVLYLKQSEGGAGEVRTFRYLMSMDAPIESGEPNSTSTD